MINKKCNWGGKRKCAGRKKTCNKKVPFNRRINENILNILKEYAKNHNITDTQALENAILLQTNIEKLKGGKYMKIAIPTAEGKLCGHFGHCETFTFVEVDEKTKEILSITNGEPEEGISCHSAAWIAEQGANIILAGGMGARPLMMFAECGIQVISGCPELDIKEVIELYLNQTLETGENTCASGGGCHGHEDGHHCHGHADGHHCH